MLRNFTNQRGFAAVEAVLILVIVAIIGGTGYYVYHANKSTAVASANNVKNTGATGGKGGENDSHAQTGPAKTEVFLIREWSVSSAFPPPPNEPGNDESGLIQYVIDPASQPATAKFTSQELVDLGCAADSAPAGAISRAQATDPYYLDDGTSSGKTVARQFASSPIKPYKVIGNYYYWYTGSQSTCSDNAKAPQLQKSAANEVKQIITHLEKD